jgi:hypothetical protein
VAGASSVARLTGPQDLAPSTVSSVVCAPGTLVCGVVIIKLDQAFYGKPSIIRDLRLRCCGGTTTSSVVLTTQPLFNQTKAYGAPVYAELSLPVPFDVALFAAAQEGLSMDSWPPQAAGPTVYGTISFLTSPTQSCSALGGGYSVVGLYGTPGYAGGGELTFVNSLYAICSVRCAACPAGYYCPGGTAAAVPCPANSLSVAGATAESACVCDQGFARRGSACYCPVNTFLLPPAAARPARPAPCAPGTTSPPRARPTPSPCPPAPPPPPCACAPLGTTGRRPPLTP